MGAKHDVTAYIARNALISGKTASAPKWSNVLWLGVDLSDDEQNAQSFQKMDKHSSTALKNKPVFKEWLVHIKMANLLKLGQCQICSEHFEKFPALDTNSRKWSLKLLFVNKSFGREGHAVLYYTSKSRLICL